MRFSTWSRRCRFANILTGNLMVGASHRALALGSNPAQVTIEAIWQVAQAAGQDNWRAAPIATNHLEMP